MRLALCLLTMGVLFFLLCSFSVWNIHPSTWSEDARVGLIFSWVVGAFITTGIYFETRSTR